MRANAAVKALCASSGDSAYSVIETSEPMYGSEARYRSRADRHGARIDSDARRLRLAFNTVVPVLEHIVRGWNLERPDEPESETLSVSVIPDAFRELRVLLLPGRIGSNAGSTTGLC